MSIIWTPTHEANTWRHSTTSPQSVLFSKTAYYNFGILLHLPCELWIRMLGIPMNMNFNLLQLRLFAYLIINKWITWKYLISLRVMKGSRFSPNTSILACWVLANFINFFSRSFPYFCFDDWHNFRCLLDLCLSRVALEDLFVYFKWKRNWGGNRTWILNYALLNLFQLKICILPLKN